MRCAHSCTDLTFNVKMENKKRKCQAAVDAAAQQECNNATSMSSQAFRFGLWYEFLLCSDAAAHFCYLQHVEQQTSKFNAACTEKQLNKKLDVLRKRQNKSFASMQQKIKLKHLSLHGNAKSSSGNISDCSNICGDRVQKLLNE